MTRIFDFELSDLSMKDCVKELLFITQNMSSISMIWFFLSIFYLVIVHFHTLYLVISLKITQSFIYYGTTISVYLIFRVMLGYVLEKFE